MEFAILDHAEASTPRVTFQAPDAAALRRAISGHADGGVLAVRWHDPGAPGNGGWQTVWPLRDGKPRVTHYVTFRRGLCSAPDAARAWEAAQVTAHYCRDHAAKMRELRAWVQAP
jgi:hypothetical protein